MSEESARRPTAVERYPGLIEKYRERLPLARQVRAVTLGEGNTPLVRLENLAADTGHRVALYAKFEGLNPTGSFKDRGMTVAVSQAVSEGARAIICASTGNTSASAAAYAARAGITAFVIIPDGKIAMGKLAQAMMHGAVVIQIKGNFDQGMQLVKDVAGNAPVTIVNSVNPYRLQGQKTIAFEIIEQLGGPPDYHCLPVGNAGNITAHWIGYSECASASGEGLTEACNFCDGHCRFARDATRGRRPIMLGYQASGAAPFVRGHAIETPETVATAIRIGRPQSWDLAWAASRESGGWFDHFADEEILAAQKRLGEREGIFCEPASAVSVAGALRDVENGRIPAGSTVVCTLTGHGLKDPDVAIRQSEPVVPVAATLESVRAAIVDHLP